MGVLIEAAITRPIDFALVKGAKDRIADIEKLQQLKIQFDQEIQQLGYNKFGDFTVLDKLVAAAQLQSDIETIVETLSLYKVWQGWDTKPEASNDIVTLGKRVRVAVSKLINLADEPMTVSIAAKKWLIDGRDYLEESKLISVWQALETKWQDYSSLTEQAKPLDYNIASHVVFTDLVQSTKNIIAQKNKLKAWCEWRASEQKSSEYGLNVVVIALENGRLKPEECEAQVLTAFCQWLAPQLLDNTDQQRTIEDLLDDARRADPSIAEFFQETDDYDPVFVKNLESVQGDERDVIILSLGYGPAEPSAPTMSMNFGPLNKQGGERRLNVAITRATSEVLLFCSFDSSMIDLSRISSTAVEHLKHYIEFAERGPKALAQQYTAEHGVDQFDSDFERAVAYALRAKGWRVQT